MLLQKYKNLVPAVERLLGPVRYPIGIEEGVPASVVAMKFVILAEFLEHFFRAIDVIAVRILVVIAEYSEDRATQLLGQVDGRGRPPRIKLFPIVHHDIAAPAVHQRIEAGDTTGDQISVPPAGTESDHAHLAV